MAVEQIGTLDSSRQDGQRPRLRRAPMYTPGRLLVLMLPYLVLLSIGFGFPLINAFVESLVGTESLGSSYQALGADPVFWEVMIRTIRTAGIVSLLCLLIGYPIAEFISGASPRIRPVLLALVIVPFWSSVVARTYGWFGVFVKDGIVDQLAGLFGGGNQLLLYSQIAVITGMVHVLLPIFVLPVYAAVAGYDTRLSMASLSLGAGRIRTLLSVKFPVLAPSVLAATTGVFIIALGFFVTPALLGGPTSQLISNLVSQQVFQRFDLPRAQAMSILLLVSTLFFLALLGGSYRLLKRRIA